MKFFGNFRRRRKRRNPRKPRISIINEISVKSIDRDYQRAIFRLGVFPAVNWLPSNFHGKQPSLEYATTFNWLSLIDTVNRLTRQTQIFESPIRSLSSVDKRRGRAKSSCRDTICAYTNAHTHIYTEREKEIFR